MFRHVRTMRRPAPLLLSLAGRAIHPDVVVAPTGRAREISPVCDLEFLRFQLFDVLKIENTLLKSDRYSHIAREDIEGAITNSHDLAERYFLPHSRKSDTNEPSFSPEAGVKIIPEVSEALKVFKEAGYFSAGADMTHGGMQFPYTIVNALALPFTTANVGTISYPFLTIAAASMLSSKGTPEQVDKYLGAMLEGRYFGTMNLSETQAGSSLGDITTTAVPISGSNRGGGGKYIIKGSKMWISAGDHELSENIIHMVLAKVKDEKGNSKPGVKGISLFIVPKYHVNEDKSIGARNDVTLVGLNHKMGYRGTTNCVLNYGENDSCEGELLGEEGQGLATMFLMMNEARIGVGLGAAALGYAGYASSLQYAQERCQGRSLTSRDPTAGQVPIIQHPDVKRMLLIQKTYVEGAMSLCFFGSYLVDLLKTNQAYDNMSLEETHALLDTLTPVIKAWPSEWCLEANKWAIQIFGGYGYTRDYPVEQHYRDNRLNMIHEGTNGIQSLDLLVRKMQIKDGVGMKVLYRAISSSITDAKPHKASINRRDELSAALDLVRDVTVQLSEDGRKNPERMISNSHEYLNMVGRVVIAWQWLKMETAAHLAAPGGKKYDKIEQMSEESLNLYHSACFMSEYYFKHELPKIHAQASLLSSMDNMNVKCPVNYL